ncbi:hypothetical protein [Halopelagius fulvigenes]|uniref:Uncharacterized protein n=1 Tax=Halopelagius fulvigenes TaxID=1198324 RepID=A0ABD5U4W1_9EURY
MRTREVAEPSSTDTNDRAVRTTETSVHTAETNAVAEADDAAGEVSA